MTIRQVALFCAITTASSWAQALALSPAHLAAAERLTCVLADDALGYVNDAEFDARFDAAVRGFDDEAVDIIYAKALGYVDGLLFGLRAGAEANERLQVLRGSDACSARAAATAGTSRQVSL